MKSKGSQRLRRVVWLAFVGLTVGLMGGVPSHVAAGQLSSRSIFIGSPTPLAVTNHTFRFTFENTTNVGSIVFEYCTTPLFAEPCTPVPGVDVSGVTLQDQFGETGFSIGATTASTITLTRTPRAVATLQSGYDFANAVNPSTAARTFFVRISTYASTDGSGVATDAGSVANSTTQSIHISTEVPPILNFCVGLTIPGDCSTATGDFVQLGNLSSSQTSTGNSQFWVGTNAQNGYSITMAGGTMTSGTNTIPALAVPTLSAPGTSQFGLNLRANTIPASGQDPAGPGPGSPAADYNLPNRFTFHSGDTVAAATIPADWQRFTATYIVNISPLQSAGIYSTTLTYICSAGF